MTHLTRVSRSILTLVLFIICLTGRTQTIDRRKLELIQGIWAGIMNSESERLYKITKGNKSLGVSYTINSSISDFYINESIEGFQNYNHGEIDSINIKWLSQGGKYYTLIIDEDRIDQQGWVSIDYCQIPSYFECDGELMSINGGQLVEYGKRQDLPFEALDKIYRRGKLDRRDYLYEYLDLRTASIRSSNCILYSEPRRRTSQVLSDDQVVVIIDEVNQWLKVMYADRAFGWIKKEDIN